MAIKLIANYCKRLGLPGYSSHQFSVSIETELSSNDDVARESARLYQELQSSVDEQMLQTGFVPPGDYGMEPDGKTNQNPTSNNRSSTPHQGNFWQCSAKQKELILKIVDEHQLDKSTIESLARERFRKGVRQLNKKEASALIDELLETHGNSFSRNSHTSQRSYERKVA